MADFPIVITTAGVQPTPPATIRTALLAGVSAEVPGYTATLPGSMIEDISSTDVGAIALCDAAKVEAINSLTPYGANAFLLNQLGQIYIGQGTAPAPPTNTSVSVVLSAVDPNSPTTPVPGWTFGIGFQVTDGTYIYTVQDGGVTASDGNTAPLFCLATIAGSWPVPPNTVTVIVTSVPDTITASCVNPLAGTPGGDAESEESYRARVVQAGQAISQGVPQMLKTALGKVSGVQQRLISVKQKTAGWEVIVGGGDPYQVGGAILAALLDVSSLVGSTLAVTDITQANPGIVTTDINHGYATGQTGVVITGVIGMTPINGLALPAITVIDEKTFSIGVDTTGYPAYVSGGVVTPNLRNVVVDINDFPDIYAIPFVNPPVQTVAVQVTWNTSAPNFVSGAAVAQLGAPALVAYINKIPVGQPINLFQLQSVFQAAIASVLSPDLLTSMVFSVSINGIGTSPISGTGIIQGDPESYFLTTEPQIVIEQA